MNKLDVILTSVFNLKNQDYTDQTEVMQFKDWDSMTHMLLITRIEDDFEIFLEGGEIATMRTVGQIKEVLSKHSITL